MKYTIKQFAKALHILNGEDETLLFYRVRRWVSRKRIPCELNQDGPVPYYLIDADPNNYKDGLPKC